MRHTESPGASAPAKRRCGRARRRKGHLPLAEAKSSEATALLAKLENNVASVFLGKPEVVRLALVAAKLDYADLLRVAANARVERAAATGGLQ